MWDMILIDFVNVGYGDCTLIREIEGERTVFAMLVDCGDVHIPRPEHSGRLSGWEFLQAEGIDHLDLVVITHLHLDHVGGLSQIVNHCTVGTIWCNHLPPERFWGSKLMHREPLSPGSENLFVAYNLLSGCLAKLRAKGTAIGKAPQVQKEVLPGAGKLQATVTYGDKWLSARQDNIWEDTIKTGAKDGPLTDLDGWINDTSIRLRLSWKGWEVELPGDLGVARWQAAQPDPCHILKLPHHGHRECITPSLLQHLSPASTVICVSNDRTDDCPSLETLGLLQQEHREVYFTDAIPWNGKVGYQHSVRFRLKGEPGSEPLPNMQGTGYVIENLPWEEEREVQPIKA
jgi:beta-lactamase superfamily II metal-dependent hydrolase